MAFDSHEIAAKLELYSTLLALVDEDSFKSRAFSNAARTISSLEESLDKLIAENRLSQIKGIGKNTASIIIELAQKNTFADLETIQQKVPVGVLDLLKVQGLGPQKAKQLWHESNITSLAELETAITEGRLNKLSGFGGKTIEKFQQSLEFLKIQSHKHLRLDARKSIVKLHEALKDVLSDEILVGGSWRRGNETIRDLDVILRTDRSNVAQVNLSLQANVKDLSVEEKNDKQFLEGTFGAFQIEISACSTEEFPFRSLIVTGSKTHYQTLSEYAVKNGFQLTPSCLLDKDGVKILVASEEEIYTALGLEYVPPPLREDKTILRPLGSGKYTEPVKVTDLKGILHVHTTYSDGHSTLEQMSSYLNNDLAAKYKTKFEYIGICDHSQAAAYARGLTPDRVKAQWQEIDELNEKLAPFKILKGTEVDILAGGKLDFDDNLLSQFDFVVASVHSGFKMTEEEATDRLCNAISNPHVDILGHMTGRLLLERDGYPVNHEKVIECAAKYKKAIELNCNPHRLDIDWRWLKIAMDAGVVIPIDPDSHSARALEDIEYGIDLAAKGPVTPAFCPSTWTANKFLDWCKQHS